MSTSPKQTRGKRPPQQPEFKIGPFIGGIGVAVWLNTIETADGPKTLRSITIAPRRYKDPQTGEWKDAASYRPGDLTTLILALEKAREYVLTTPLPGEHSEDDRLDGSVAPDSAP